MNHYEELGVSRSASTAEIRQAYKALVRVLHPDQQQDENLRRLSELQLRRLNHILQVLTDPMERRNYDLSLDRFLPQVRPLEARQKVSLSDIRSVRIRLHIPPGILVWVLIGAIALGSVIFWLRSPEPQSQSVRRPDASSEDTPKTSSPLHAASSQASLRPAEPMQQGPRHPEAKPSALGVPISHQKNTGEPKMPMPAESSAPKPAKAEAPFSPVEKSVSESRNTEIASAPPAVPEPQELPPPSPVSKTSSKAIAGKWLYVPQSDDGKPSLYPPEYIELRISNRAGVLRGRYLGRYRVSDRAISSEINFQFEGRQGDSVSVLPWSSNNGAKGELRLKRLSDESIEVNWITTIFGRGNTLASGTAVLYRSDPP